LESKALPPEVNPMTLIRARAYTEPDERISITAIVWFCDSCGDHVIFSHQMSEHVYIPTLGRFHIEGDPKMYIVRCASGHEERYRSSEVYATVSP
jgi:hypothetical protein